MTSSVIGLARLETEQGCQDTKIQGPLEPMVKLKVGDQIIAFIVDTGAEMSVVICLSYMIFCIRQNNKNQV